MFMSKVINFSHLSSNPSFQTFTSVRPTWEERKTYTKSFFFVFYSVFPTRSFFSAQKDEWACVCLLVYTFFLLCFACFSFNLSALLGCHSILSIYLYTLKCQEFLLWRMGDGETLESQFILCVGGGEEALREICWWTFFWKRTLERAESGLDWK